MVIRRLLVLAACAAGSSLGCAAEGPDVATQELAVVNGVVDNGDEAVVALLLSDGGQYCSGTLISSRVVVTAAHCVPPALNDSIEAESGFNPNIQFADLSVFFGTDVTGQGTIIPVASGEGHASFSITALPNDIAVLALAEDAPTQPKAVVSRVLSDGDYRGQTGRVVGFGLTSADGLDNGVKHEGTTRITDVDATSIWLDMDPSATCNGDSGGPLFMDVDGSERFVGVHSRSDCVTDGNDERVDQHLGDFVMPFVSAHGGGLGGDGPGATDPECTSDGVCAEVCRPGADPDCDGSGGGGPNAIEGGCRVAPARRGTGSMALVFAMLLAGFVLHLRDAHGLRHRGRAHPDR